MSGEAEERGNLKDLARGQRGVRKPLEEVGDLHEKSTGSQSWASRKGWGHMKFLTWFFELPILNEHIQRFSQGFVFLGGNLETDPA